MIAAGLWGALGAAFLVVGAAVGFVADVRPRTVGLILAFGAGTLFGAVAYELIAEAVRLSVTGVDVAVGFAAGAITFYVGSLAIDRVGSQDRAGAGGSVAADPPGGAATDPPGGAADPPGARNPRAEGLALVLGSVLDGLPESVVLGLSFVPGAGVGIPVLVAIAVSNFPEGLSATKDLAEAGLQKATIVRLWVLVVVVSGLAAAIGYGVLGTLGQEVDVLLEAFAAGAILAMLSESMIPEAYQTGGRAVGLATTLGFAVAAYLALQG